MTRRDFLTVAGTFTVSSAIPAPAATASMGIATTCYMAARRPADAYEFLEYAHTLGAGGIQTQLNSMDRGYVRKLRRRAEELGMYVEIMAGLPKEDESFEKTVLAAREAGALCLRSACLGGRRYENFSSLEEWNRFVGESREKVARAVAIVEKHKIPLALENHKDWTAEEMAALMKKHSSEYLGVCLDTGNNISLLDDPMDVVERLATYALSTHLKDMAVDEAPDGFLLSEVPMGEGILDLKRVLGLIREARPATRITLEMITRNPLLVPCLTDKFWVTFPERNGTYLARTLAMVRIRKRPLPRLDGMDRPAQLALEDQNVRKCLAYGRNELGLA